MKTGKGGATYIEYPDFIEALAKLAQMKYDYCDGPIELFNRLVDHELLVCVCVCVCIYIYTHTHIYV